MSYYEVDMEFIHNNETLTFWLLEYGSVVLFILLALGIIALPVPEETLLVLAGTLLANQKLQLIPTLLATYGGSITGITVSYIVGRTAGTFFIHRWGSWLGITEERVEYAHSWFEKYGKWTLFIGYFIPGLRHFTGVSAGVTHLHYKHFALFAYAGALFWVSTFLSVGYFFGSYWISFFENLEITFDWVFILILLVALGLIIYLIREKQERL